MKKITALVLALVLVMSLASCAKPGDGGGQGDVPGDTTPGGTTPGGTGDGDRDTQEPGDVDGPGTEEPDDDGPAPEEPEDGALRIGLTASASAITAAGLGEGYELETGVSDLDAAFAGGLDGAIVPVSEAARLYNTSDGAVVIAALVTSGGWELTRPDGDVKSVFDLAQRTVSAPEGAAGLILERILTGYDFEIGASVFIVPAGEEADFALLSSLDAAAAGEGRTIRLADEWTDITGESLLPSACLAVRADLPEEELEGLLRDLESSVKGSKDNLDAAVALGLAGSRDLAARALESESVHWLTGADALREGLTGYLSALYRQDPACIGSHIPDDGFYR